MKYGRIYASRLELSAPAFDSTAIVGVYPDQVTCARILGCSRQAVQWALNTHKPIKGYWLYSQKELKIDEQNQKYLSVLPSVNPEADMVEGTPESQ